MQIWAESGKSALPICNYSQILYQFLTFTQNLKRSQSSLLCAFFARMVLLFLTVYFFVIIRPSLRIVCYFFNNQILLYLVNSIF